jgi:uncharacterized protein (TIGR00369 family)
MTQERRTDGWLPSPPFQHHLGIETVEAAEGRTLLRFTFKPEHANRKGDVHGGVLATLIDLAMSQAIRSVAKDVAGMSTVNMTINYLDTASGDLVARGKAMKIGRTIAVGEATCETADGRVVAHGTGAFRLIGHRKSS